MTETARRRSVEPFEPADSTAWDALVARSPSGTFLHSRRFLGHQGDRFEDASLVLRDMRDAIAGALPAAVSRSEGTTVVSHPGATFGGLVHDGSVKGALAVEAFEQIRDHYASRGFRSLQYKPTPWIYHRNPSDDDLFALQRLGATCAKRNLSCCVDLSSSTPRSERRRRGHKRAERAGVEVEDGPECIAALWGVLEENLERRYGARPVHDESEIRLLHDLFPDRIRFVLARIEEEPVAGVVLFLNDPVAHAQYIAASEAGYDASALDLVFATCLDWATETSYRYFDFGTSNTPDGGLNDTLYEFKAGFGGGGVAYDLYELPLSA